MSKITFRADNELIERIEEFDASKSQIMREAIREYLDSHEDGTNPSDETLDALVSHRIDELLEQRLTPNRNVSHGQPQDVNVTIQLETDSSADTPTNVSVDRDDNHVPTPTSDESNTCRQCGETLSDDHVYCPNCGEKAARRVFCECGDELRTDWGFCPSCGRRTPSADILDQP